MRFVSINTYGRTTKENYRKQVLTVFHCLFGVREIMFGWRKRANVREYTTIKVVFFFGVSGRGWLVGWLVGLGRGGIRGRRPRAPGGLG